MNDYIPGTISRDGDFVPARPVIRSDGGALVVFYPLYGHARRVSSVHDEIVVTRMMVKKSILLRLERSVTCIDPTLIFCRSCKLGAAGSRGHALIIKCTHGVWSREMEPKATAAHRLGAHVAQCDFCGRIRQADPTEWSFFGDAPPTTSPPRPPPFLQRLHYCGDTCRDRAYKLRPLA